MPRKKPFSGKQKKKQLQDRRVKKQDGPRYLSKLERNEDEEDDDEEEEKIKLSSSTENGENHSEHAQIVNPSSGDDSLRPGDFAVHKINEQPQKKSKSQSINQFRLHFFRENEQAIEKGKRNARKPIRPVDERHMELGITEVYPPEFLLDFPKRPSWNYSLTKEKLDAQEHHYFKDFLSRIQAASQERSLELSYFELNLETWRQLWRVLELSDVFLIICDARHPALHLPPSLIQYIVQDLHKFVIIILNKIDFLPPLMVSLWKSYLEHQFPGTRVVLFSSFLKEDMYNDSNFYSLDSAKEGLNKKYRQGSSFFYGPSQLYEICKDIVKEKVNLSSWRRKLEEDGFIEADESSAKPEEMEEAMEMEETALKTLSCSEEDDNDIGLQMSRELSRGLPSPKRPLFANGILTLGCIGFPNVGKSSVLNALNGKKVSPRSIWFE